MLRGSGEQLRDYIYVDDFSSSIYSLICTDYWHHSVLNLASGFSFSANQIVDLLNVNGISPCVTRSSDSSSYDVTRSIVDNSRLCHQLNRSSDSFFPFTASRVASLLSF